MSGGYFDYVQFDMYSKAILPLEEIFKEPDLSDRYSQEVIDQMKKGLSCLKVAHEYLHQIDWLLSGDTADDSFLEDLEKGLNNLTNTKEESQEDEPSI